MIQKTKKKQVAQPDTTAPGPVDSRQCQARHGKGAFVASCAALGTVVIAIALCVPSGNATQSTSAQAAITCANKLRDQATGACGIRASTVPTPGMLYPLGPEFSLDASGNVTAAGIVESLSGGFRFPDGSVQTTALQVGACTGQIPIGQADMPLVISTPGSYVVVEPLAGDPGSNGIAITVDDVTLDLNGFALVGAPGSLDGINITSGTRRGVLVCNGTLRGWGNDGVDAAGGASAVHEMMLRNLTVIGNGGNGIRAGSVVHVISCSAIGNTSVGIQVGGGCIVRGNHCRDNGSHGITTENSCAVMENHVEGHCSGSAIRVTGLSTTVLDNWIINSSTGIEVTNSGCIVARNTVSSTCGSTDYSVPGGLGAVTSDPSSAGPWGNISF